MNSLPTLAESRPLATHSTLYYFTALIAVALLPVGESAAAPAPAARRSVPSRRTAHPAPEVPWQRQLELHKKNAARLAAGKKWDQALAEIHEAKRILQAGARQERRADQQQPKNPGYDREMSSLRKWLREQQSLARQKKADMNRTLETFQEKRAVIGKKYGVKPEQALDRFRRMQAEQAKYVLMGADLDDLAADYAERKGDRETGQESREDATLARLHAYKALGKVEDATTQAEKLLAANSANPIVYDAAGQYLQTAKQWAKAAGAWQQVIQLTESGKVKARKLGMGSPSLVQPGRQLATYYRQLAFCDSRLGKAAESKSAMEKARSLEAATPPAAGRRR